MIEDRSSPRPVSVSTATIRPAAAVVAATGSTPVAPLASASNTRGGVIRRLRSRKDSRNASAVAYTTALNADWSSARRPTMTISELKWYPKRPSSRQKLCCSMGTARTPNRRASNSTARKMPR
jgi:hypothetical protein